MEARWLLGYLLSKPDNWTVRMADIRKKGGCGRDKARAMVAELVELGYAEREDARDGGKFSGVNLVIYDEPSVASLPQTDLPAPAEPATAKPAPVNPPPSNTDDLAKTDHQIEREARERDTDQEGESGPEDPKAVERGFRRAFPQWPTYVGDSEPAARAAWQQLSPDERAEAVARIGDYVEAAKAGGRKAVCSFGIYLGEKRWEKLPKRAAEAPATHLSEAPFGKGWGAMRFAELIREPGRMPLPTAFIQRIIEQGGEAGARERLAHQARHGWPVVNQMHANAAERRGFSVPIEIAALGEGFRQVKADSDLMAAWRAAHERRGWPWLPDGPDWVWMPPGEDPEAAIEAFAPMVRDLGGGESEAAE